MRLSVSDASAAEPVINIELTMTASVIGKLDFILFLSIACLVVFNIVNTFAERPVLHHGV